jgi:hypothetical protein
MPDPEIPVKNEDDVSMHEWCIIPFASEEKIREISAHGSS